MKSIFRFFKILVILAIFPNIFNSQLTAEVKKAKIYLDLNDTIPSNNTPLLFGQFIEFLQNIINSPTGFWAQELKNRGLDAPEYIGSKPTGTSEFWKVLKSENTSNIEVYQYSGGYNLNGTEYQVLTNKNENLISGIYQTVYVDDEVGSNFYVYLKGYGFDENSKLIISLSDSITNKIIDSVHIRGNEIGSNWKKFNKNFKAHSDIKINNSASHRANLNILLEGNGTVNIDEVSLMQSDNIDGIKKSMYEMFVKLKPGILRYPGGEFADSRMFNWQNTTEHIDQRQSPNNGQRVDFGLHQFMKFCKEINTLPYLVANQENDNLQSNVNFIEYCNSDTTTNMGRLRAKNGDIEPFNVKYWCVGNEQWMPNYIDFAYDYNNRVKEMKKKDSTFTSVLWGNIWQGYEYFDSVMKVVGYNTQNYSYHITALCLKVDDVNDTLLEYNYTVGGAEIARHSTNDVFKWLKNNGYYPKIKHSIPEWWPNYEPVYQWLDTAKEANRIESAIVSSQFLNHYFKASETLELAIRTTGLAFLRCGYNSRGKRLVYGTPDLHSYIMYRNHFGNRTLNTKVICENYSLPMKIGYADVFQNNRVEAVATKSKDTLYLHIINKYPADELEIELNFDLDSLGQNIKFYTVNSDYITAENSPDYPNLISEKEYNISLQKIIRLPKLSVSILAIPLSKNINSVDDLSENLVEITNKIVKDLLIINNLKSHVNIEIFDNNGRLVLSSKLSQKVNYIDTNSLTNGIYFIKASNGIKVQNLKFIKS